MSEERISALLISETATIQHPANLHESYTFININELVEVFFAFLRFPCSEPLVERVGSKTLTALSAFANTSLDPSTLPTALEDLATGFESFLKKIATVKYGEDIIKLRGDGVNYVGLLHTPLGELLIGKVGKISKSNAPILFAPVVTFAYSDNTIRTSIYNHIRQLRNEIHVATQKSLFDIMRLFRIVTAGYLFAVEENIHILREKTDPLFCYLKHIQESFQRWDHSYVELHGEERAGDPASVWSDLHVFEWREDIDADPEEDSELGERSARNKDVHRVHTQPASYMPITDIANGYDRFWLIGEPGAGKSTTLQRLALRAAKEILYTGYYQSKSCPILINANQFDRNHSFLAIVADLVKVGSEQVNSWLREGKLWLLIDGLNEVATSEQEYAYRDLHHILSRFDQVSLIVSSRKHDFNDRLGIPVFELLPFTEAMIQDYLERNIPSADHGRTLFKQLAGEKGLLLDLARNPLMLRMLIRVSKEGNIPSSKGLIFKLFVHWILSRERKVRQFDTFLKEKVLMALAFHIRQSGMTYALQPSVFISLRETLAHWHMHADMSDLFGELLDNHILEIDASGRVTFFHELALEYFVALELQYLYILTKDEIRVYYNENKWFESLLMLSHLLDDANDLVKSIAQENLVLAAKCVVSGARVTHSARTIIVEAAAQALFQHDSGDRKQAALTALLEFATNDSLRLVIKALSDEPTYGLTEALSACERPERAVLGLLKSGLHDKERIYQCLRVFRKRAVSLKTLDHPLFTQAVRALLEGDIQDRYLTLISDIDISKGVKEQVISVIRNVLETADPASLVWRSAISLASRHRFLEEFSDIIEDRILNCDGLNARAYYAVFVACLALPEPTSSRLAIYGAKQCLRSGWPILAVKYIQQFKLQEVVEVEVMECLAILAKEGRIGALLGFAALYSHVDFEETLSTAVDTLLAQSKLETLYQFHSGLSSVLCTRPLAIKDKLIEEFLLSRLNVRKMRRYIKAFGLQPHFSNYGVVRKISERRYGFIIDLVTGGDIFFHFSRVANLRQVNTVKLNDLVQYHDQPSLRNLENREAVKVTILRGIES